MDVLACVCTAIATALTIFISEAIWQRHKVKTDNTKGHQSSVSDTSGTKTYSSEAVQVPETDGLDSSAGSENSDVLSSYTDRSACQVRQEDCSSKELHATMGEKDNLGKKVVTSELTDTTQIVKSDKQDLSAKLDTVYIGSGDENDLNEVFFNFEKTGTVSAKEDAENNVDVVADNNRNHETETKCYPKRTRRMSDVIDSIGDSFSSDKSGRYSRKSSSSSPPATPPSDAGYSSVHSTPSHTKPARVTACRLNDTTDAGCTADKFSCQGTADAGPTEMDDNETTDAGPISQQFDDLSDMIVGGPVIEAAMPVGRYAEEYNMNHRRRGHAIIFNNDTFDTPGVSNRSGSEADVKNLNRLFTALEFEITVHHNKEYSEIKKILQDLSNEDHSDADCIVVAVLTHGLRQGYILSKDVPYSVDYLWKPFTADKCTTLAGKPKIFIVQACRGDQVDSGVKLVRSRTQTDSSQEAYKIPTHADFLIAYSSAEGFYSWRNPESGTWFIQCLCEELLAHAETTDLLKVLTRTSRRVAVDFESFNDAVLWQHAKKQVPSITTMLIRDVYFRPKK